MALELFLRVDGIVGASRNFHHQGWADVLSWQWSLVAAGAGPAKPAAMVLVKAVGPESAGLLELYARGATVASAELDIIPSVGKRETAQRYLSLKLSGVRVLALAVHGGIEDGQCEETVKLGCDSLRYEYVKYAAIGSDGGAAQGTVHGYDWTPDNAA